MVSSEVYYFRCESLSCVNGIDLESRGYPSIWGKELILENLLLIALT